MKLKKITKLSFSVFSVLLLSACSTVRAPIKPLKICVVNTQSSYQKNYSGLPANSKFFIKTNDALDKNLNKLIQSRIKEIFKNLQFAVVNKEEADFILSYECNIKKGFLFDEPNPKYLRTLNLVVIDNKNILRTVPFWKSHTESEGCNPNLEEILEYLLATSLKYFSVPYNKVIFESYSTDSPVNFNNIFKNATELDGKSEKTPSCQPYFAYIRKVIIDEITKKYNKNNGSVFIKFVLDSSGRLISSSIEPNSSDDKYLQKLVISALKTVSPFPKLPPPLAVKNQMQFNLGINLEIAK